MAATPVLANQPLARRHTTLKQAATACSHGSGTALPSIMPARW